MNTWLRDALILWRNWASRHPVWALLFAFAFTSIAAVALCNPHLFWGCTAAYLWTVLAFVIVFKETL